MSVPKATVCNLLLLNGLAKRPRWASPSDFIPLILTFQPGEGALGEYVAVFPENSTKSRGKSKRRGT